LDNGGTFLFDFKISVESRQVKGSSSMTNILCHDMNTEREYGLCCRIFWLLSFLISAAVVAHFTFRIWMKWNTSPVLVSFANVQTPVWNIPFPAITICPQVKLKKTLFSYSTTVFKDNMTDEE
jgi:amiloride-sensitive sodium channel